MWPKLINEQEEICQRREYLFEKAKNYGDFLKEQNQALLKDLHLDGRAPEMSA